MCFKGILILSLVCSITMGAPGDYSFSYDTGTGGYHEQQATGGGSVSGKYGFSGADGSNVAVSYSAGANGGGAAPPSGNNGNGAASAAPSNGNGGGIYNLNLSPGGIYSYDFNIKDQSKSESRGADGEVEGKYSYKGKDGDENAITYTAGVQGFLPQGESIPKAPPAPPAPQAAAPLPPPQAAAPLPPPPPPETPAPSSDSSVEGKYSISNEGGSQQSSYTADAKGFKSLHSITINFG